ncbi:MAG: DUF2961 domain-containing protein [Gemmatimonadota bacterium]
MLTALVLGACSTQTPPPRPPPIPTAEGLDRLFGVPTSSFRHVSSYDTTGGNRDRHEVAVGDSVVLVDVGGPGVIRRLWMTVASPDPHYLRRISLEMYWDDEVEPSVRVPLGDFFGNGFDRRHYAALPMGVSSGGFYSYLPMPFHRRARIVARNDTGKVIDALYVNADVELVRSLPAPLATFHAVWNRDPRTTGADPHLALRARGAGHLVGLSLNAEGHDGSFFFLEGDERFVVDGVFRGQGTGTEDYFNAGWYFDQGPFAAPFHGLVVKDDQRGRIAAYRWHVPDPVPFHDSIRVELEHGHGNHEIADYATVAYWYQTEPHAPLPPLPPANDRRVLSVHMPRGVEMLRDLAVREDTAGLVFEVPVPRPDLYEVRIYPVGAPGAGLGLATVDGGRPFTVALEDPDRGTVLAPVTLDTVPARLSFELVWSGSLSPAGVEPRPVRRFARPWSVVGPFPNPQTLGTEHSPAVDQVYGPERDPDLGRSYRLGDGREVSWVPVDGPEDGYVRLNPHFRPSDWVAAYAQSFLWSPDERGAVLLLGADDAHVLWVNGVRVSERQGRNIAVTDDVAIPVTLRAGWNRVLLKVADLDGGWAFRLRAADPEGVLRWARRPAGA